ncbi:stage III sporulation protein AF [Metabacillus malikii]|uniref:Stage III sporulation protein AF n=1 Tax=Metabacillus malikii TaxID=1504265 RepID=A0ABT9ZI20_9BACI|nr:stage III sporulation protein AF [Metabacillus malikii]MDQ0231928.1 stage III sporulation protein AF [Metabacillus malikii]
MQFLTEWITNIIVFIFLAVIIDLLLPNSTMQKYAKMVISLLLVIVIINPIFKIFSTDMNAVLEDFQLGKRTSEENEVKNLIEFQKKEIQASHRAYILEQMAVQMKTMADEELVEKYDVKIENILLSDTNQVNETISHSDLTEIKVELTPYAQSEIENDDAVEVIKLVEIDTTTDLKEEEPKINVNTEAVTATLAEIWEVEAEKISLQMEGGRSHLDE